MYGQTNRVVLFYHIFYVHNVIHFPTHQLGLCCNHTIYVLTFSLVLA